MSASQREYWSLDIPGLSEDQAQALRVRLAPEFEFGVIVSDPRDFMTRHSDRATVLVLAHCLRAGLAAGGMSPADEEGAGSLPQHCEEWLRQARE